jgi:hypothetical protein
MPSAKFQFPVNMQDIAANTAFTIKMGINGMQTGVFVNAEKSYFAAPQQLNAQQQIIGHSHVVIELLTSLTQTTTSDPTKFAFFQGLNSAAVGGVLTADVTSGLPAGAYKLSSINTAGNHQPCLVPVAQHGSLDDAVYVCRFYLFTVFSLSSYAPVISSLSAGVVQARRMRLLELELELQIRLMQLAQPRQVRQLEAKEEPPPPLLRLLQWLPEQPRVVLVAKLALAVPVVSKEEPTVARVNKVVVSYARPTKSILPSSCLLSSPFIAHIVVVPHTLPAYPEFSSFFDPLVDWYHLY